MSTGAKTLRTSSVVLLTASMLLPGEAWSQEKRTAASPIAVGTRVRVLAPTAIQGPIQGTVMEIDDASLLVGTDDHRPLRLSRQAITQLEVGVGRRGRARKGALIGAGIGAAALAVVPRDEYCADLRPGETCPTKAELVGLGVVGGALWGALIGHFIKRDRWSSVPVETLAVGLAPARGRGVQLSLAVGW